VKHNFGNAVACYHNPEIDWSIGKVKMIRCPEECEKQ